MDFECSSNSQKILVLSLHHRVMLGSLNTALLVYYAISRIEISHYKFLSIISSNRFYVSFKLCLYHFVKGNDETPNIRFRFQKTYQSTPSSIIKNGQEVPKAFMSRYWVRPSYINTNKIKRRSWKVVIEWKRQPFLFYQRAYVANISTWIKGNKQGILQRYQHIHGRMAKPKMPNSRHTNYNIDKRKGMSKLMLGEMVCQGWRGDIIWPLQQVKSIMHITCSNRLPREKALDKAKFRKEDKAIWHFLSEFAYGQQIEGKGRYTKNIIKDQSTKKLDWTNVCDLITFSIRQFNNALS